MLLKRSRWDIPIHLKYREQKESSDNELDVEVIEIKGDEELWTPVRRRDAVSAE